MTYIYREDAETWRDWCPGCNAEEHLQVEDDLDSITILFCRSCASVSGIVRDGAEIERPYLIEQGSDEDDQRKPPSKLEVQVAVAIERGRAIHARRADGRAMNDAAFDLGIPTRSARRCLQLYYEANPDVPRVLYIDRDALDERDAEVMDMVESSEPGDGTDWSTVAFAFDATRISVKRAYERATGKSSKGVFKRKTLPMPMACVPRDIHTRSQHAA